MAILMFVIPDMAEACKPAPPDNTNWWNWEVELQETDFFQTFKTKVKNGEIYFVVESGRELRTDHGFIFRSGYEFRIKELVDKKLIPAGAERSFNPQNESPVPDPQPVRLKFTYGEKDVQLLGAVTLAIHTTTHRR